MFPGHRRRRRPRPLRGNYVDFTYDNAPCPHDQPAIPVYAGPTDYSAVPDTLFRNNGDGTFADVSRGSGIGGSPGTGMGMVCSDYDDDGDTDIFVCNDAMANFLFRNDGRGQLRGGRPVAGVAYDARERRRQAWASTAATTTTTAGWTSS